MPNDLKQDAASVKLGHAPRCNPAGLALQMGLVGIVDAGARGAFYFAANRADRTAKAFRSASTSWQGIVDESSIQERNSNPFWPRVMRCVP